MSESISIGNEIKDGYEETQKWVQNNIKWLSTVGSFYRERAKLEKEYSEKLSQLTKEYFSKKSAETVVLSVGNTPAITPGSLESASQVTWNEVLTQSELMAKDHDKFANDITIYICEQLRTLTVRCEMLFSKAERLNQEVVDRKDTCYNNLEKAKKKYYDACQAMETMRSKSAKYSSEKAQKKLSEKEHEMNICKNQYLVKINQANRVKDKYYFQDVPEILDILQDLNESRVAMINLIWKKAGDLERDFHKRVETRLDAVDSVIVKNKPHLDSSMFIKHNIKNWNEPKDFLYEPSSVWHDDEHFVIKSQAELQDLRLRLAKAQQQLEESHSLTESEKVALGKLHTAKSEMKSKDSFDPMKLQDTLKEYIIAVQKFTALENKKLESEVEVESIQNNVQDESVLDISDVDLSKTEKKNGLFGLFKKSTSNNIAAASDAASMVSEETHKSKNSNRFSVFKRNGHGSTSHGGAGSASVVDNDDNVSTITTPSSSHSHSAGSGNAVKGKVLYTYEKGDTDEVSVTSGAIVTVVNKDAGNGWSLIRLDSGEQGLVPQSYIEVQSGSSSRRAPPKAPQPRKSSHKTMTAAYAYQSQGADELSLSVGDKVKVLKADEGNGWTYGELNGQRGLFPTAYCT